LQSSCLDAFQDTFCDCHAIGEHGSHNGYGAFSNKSGLHPDAWDMIGKTYTGKPIQLDTSRTEKHPVSLTTTEAQNLVTHVFEPTNDSLRRGFGFKATAIATARRIQWFVADFEHVKQFYPGDSRLAVFGHLDFKDRQEAMDTFEDLTVLANDAGRRNI